MMKKNMIIVTVAVWMGILMPLVANDLYTDTYMLRSGVISPRVDTGIPSHVSADTLSKKRIRMRALVYFRGEHPIENSAQALDEIVAHAKRHGAYVSVIGHIDSYTKEDQYVPLTPWSALWQNAGDRRVSETVLINEVNTKIRRVYDLLVRKGIDSRKIYTENRMDRDPLTTEATPRGRALNRRVDVKVYY